MSRIFKNIHDSKEKFGYNLFEFFCTFFLRPTFWDSGYAFLNEFNLFPWKQRRNFDLLTQAVMPWRKNKRLIYVERGKINNYCKRMMMIIFILALFCNIILETFYTYDICWLSALFDRVNLVSRHYTSLYSLMDIMYSIRQFW